MTDLILDPNIRKWVFIPIVIMTFLLGIVKHYLAMCLETDVNIEMQQVQDTHVLLRCRALRLNASCIPKTSFLQRVQYFTNEKFLSKTKTKPKENFPNFDTNTCFNMLKNNLINILPMFLAGSWIVYMFSDFIATKLPFSLTLQFKSMLQRSISLNELNDPWVSSASWYFLCVFGLRNVFNVILGENNMADPSKSMEENLTASTNTNQENLLEREIEELQMVEHDWILNELIY